MIDFRQYERGDRDICGRKCPKCGRVYYPEPMICTECGSRRDPAGKRFREWDQVPITGKCKLLSWTKLFNLPADFTDRFLLYGIVQRLAVMADGLVIDPVNLPEQMRFSAVRESGLDRALDEVERGHIRRALGYTGGNKSSAARILGIDRKTLREKLREGKST